MTVDIPSPRGCAERYRLEKCSRGYHWRNVRSVGVLSLGGAVESCRPSIHTAAEAMRERYGKTARFPGVERIVPLWVLRAVVGFTW